MAEANPTQTARPRPLSPHIQIYRPLINMMMSILHRITGAALYAGTLLLAWWLVAAATSPQYFDWVNGLLTTPLGRLVMIGYTWALMHHMLGGMRHLLWDTGRGFDLSTVDRLSWGSIIVSIALTAVIWFFALTKGAL
ncbi:MAG: succinate dehydrogenase, cytochrome b556 subunit [Hyphomicrobiaceae bacterium]